MKTSNKILLGIISVIGLCMLSILIFAKGSLIHYDQNGITGDGKIVKINHNIAEISFFRLSGQYEVYVRKGEPQLVIETDENIQSFLNPHDDNFTIIENNGEKKQTFRELRIGKFNDLNLKPSNGIKVYLTTPSLEKVRIGGTTKLIFEDQLNNEKFEAIIDDFAEVNLKLNVKQLKINTEENARLEITGTVGETEVAANDFSFVSLGTVDGQKMNIASSGNAEIKVDGKVKTNTIKAIDFAKVNTLNLKADETRINAKDNANISVSATTKLDVEAKGFATVKYLGNPIITDKITDNASLNPIEK